MTPERRILSNLLSYLIKLDDAPVSAETHLYTALNELLKLNPGFQTTDLDAIEIIEEVKDFYKAYPDYDIPSEIGPQFAKSLGNFYTNLLSNQEELGEPFARILHDNSWQLYSKLDD